MPHSDDIRMDACVAASEGFSGAECVAVAREAALLAMADDMDAATVSHRHLSSAIAGVKPQITADMLRFYASFQR